MTHVACESKVYSVVRSFIHPWPKTGLQSDVRSCIMLGMPTHLVQELNVGTVCGYHCTNMAEKTTIEILQKQWNNFQNFIFRPPFLFAKKNVLNCVFYVFSSIWYDSHKRFSSSKRIENGCEIFTFDEMFTNLRYNIQAKPFFLSYMHIAFWTPDLGPAKSYGACALCMMLQVGHDGIHSVFTIQSISYMISIDCFLQIDSVTVHHIYCKT